MACLTESLVVNGPGVNSGLSLVDLVTGDSFVVRRFQAKRADSSRLIASGVDILVETQPQASSVSKEPEWKNHREREQNQQTRILGNSQGEYHHGITDYGNQRCEPVVEVDRSEKEPWFALV